MSFDITPRVPAGRQIIKAYGDGGFEISGVAWDGSVLVSLEQTQAWSGELTIEAMAPVINDSHKPDILVIGCGPTFRLPDETLRLALKQRGIILEWMDTAAACRTYNVLAIEERSVAAALVAVQ